MQMGSEDFYLHALLGKLASPFFLTAELVSVEVGLPLCTHRS